MAKKQALGRGLAALIPEVESFHQEESSERVLQISKSDIHVNPQQPRKSFDKEKLAELAESIRAHGVMQPLLVTPQSDRGYIIVAGERRYRAAEIAGLTELPCIVRELDDKGLAELSLIENIQREDLSPLEEAAAFQSLIDLHGYTQEALSERLGKSRPYVANTLRLLKLAPQDKKLLAEGTISAGHARALLSLSDVRLRAQLSDAILKNHLSVRQAETLAAQMKQSAKTAAANVRASRERRVKQLLHKDMAREFSHRLGVKVRIEGAEGKGRVIIDFNSEDDLQNINDAILR